MHHSELPLLNYALFNDVGSIVPDGEVYAHWMTQNPVQDMSNMNSNSSWLKMYGQQQRRHKGPGVDTCLHVHSRAMKVSLFLEYMIGGQARTKIKQRYTQYNYMPCSSRVFREQTRHWHGHKHVKGKKKPNKYKASINFQTF